MILEFLGNILLLLSHFIKHTHTYNLCFVYILYYCTLHLVFIKYRIFNLISIHSKARENMPIFTNEIIDAKHFAYYVYYADLCNFKRTSVIHVISSLALHVGFFVIDTVLPGVKGTGGSELSRLHKLCCPFSWFFLRNSKPTGIGLPGKITTISHLLLISW